MRKYSANKGREAALKAWKTIRRKKAAEAKKWREAGLKAWKTRKRNGN
jgi:hypothetical protein